MKSDTSEIFEIGMVGGVEPPSPEHAGFKAYNLARMARAGLPVPPAFVFGTARCRDYLEHPKQAQARLGDILKAQLARLEQACGLSFGGARKPLLLSVRSGAAVSMPGMMDTLLDIGLCDATVRGLLRLTGNPRLVWDSYRRLVQQFAEVVHAANPGPFRAALEIALDRNRVAQPQELDFQSLAQLTRDYLALFRDLTGQPFPQDPQAQLEAAVGAVFDSWRSERAVEYRRLNKLPESLGTAVTVQRMVFGNAGGTSGSGVAFTRNPASGENRLYLDFRFNSQGEDVVSGRHAANDADRLAAVLPEVQAQLLKVRKTLESEFGDVQEFEFTVQDGRLFLLQTRTGKRTPWAALRIAVEQVRDGELAPEQALERLAGIDIDKLEQRRLHAVDGAELLASAQPASVGLTSGAIALDTDAAKAFAAAGKRPILVRPDTSTADLPGIAAAVGVLTAQGGRTAHAAVVARQLGKVCLVGCSSLRIDLARRSINLGGRELSEGDPISLDAEGGRVFAGEPKTVVEKPDAWLAEVAQWRARMPQNAVA